jgi:hypothetical protein
MIGTRNQRGRPPEVPVVEPLNVGEQVFIRYGEWEGRSGQVVERQRAEVYKVRLEGGATLFFCRASLSAVPANRMPRPTLTRQGLPSSN